MRILLEPFHLKDGQRIFAQIHRQYSQITAFDYIPYDVEDGNNLSLFLPDAKKAREAFGAHALDLEKMTLFDSRVYEIFRAQPAYASLVSWINAPRLRKKNNQRKRRALVIFYYALWQLKDYDALFVWNGYKTEQQAIIKAARVLGKKVIYWEMGSFHNSLAMDEKGVNYHSRLPRDIEFYRNWAKANPNPPQKIILHKRNQEFNAITSQDKPDLSQPYVFLPLQVFNDTQLLFFSDWVKNIPHLIEVAKNISQHLPQGWRILIKEHPSCFSRYDKKFITNDKVQLANGYDSHTLIEKAQAVLTINSSVGLEAMLFQKPVITLGKSFYTFGKLTHPCTNEAEIIEALNNLDKITFNQSDREAFINYLKNAYYLDGSLKEHRWEYSEKNKRALEQALGLKPKAVVPRKDSRKNLIIARVGDNSLHEHWLENCDYEERSWDLLISCYGKNPQKWQRDNVMQIVYEGGKFDGLYDAFQQKPHILNDYENIMMADDDFIMSAQDISRFFDIVEEYNLQIAQPALTPDSFFVYFGEVQNPKFKLRWTNFCEAITVCLHRNVWKQILPLYEKNPMALRIDNFWSRLVDDPKTQVAIVDETPFAHTRAAGGELHQNYRTQMKGFFPFAQWTMLDMGYDRDSWYLRKIVNHAGVLKNGKRVEGRWRLLPRLVAGWLKTARKINRTQIVRQRKPRWVFWREIRNHLTGGAAPAKTSIIIHGVEK